MTEELPAIVPQPGILHRQMATFGDLQRRARARMPTFAYDYVDTGVAGETGLRRNAQAFEAVALTPRFGTTPVAPAMAVELFGRRYALPVGVAPMGLTSLAWPGADAMLARAAQQARIPYVLATGAAMSIEQAAALAPDVFWFQLYHLSDQAIEDDLVRRAEAAGAHVLVLTLDNAARPKRLRDLRNGLVPPFSLTPRMMAQALAAPAWLAAVARHGVPRFENVRPYMTGRPSAWDTAEFLVTRAGEVFRWDDVARIRAQWPRALVIKGLLHPDDAARALALGADGIWVSNHGGRMFDPAPASVAALPAMVAAVGGRAPVVIDSGVRGGTDVVRARALGATAAFAGRAFLFAAAALGAPGARHIIEIFADEIGNALRFLGVDGLDAVNRDLLWRQHAPA